MCNTCNCKNNSCSSIIWIILIYYLLSENNCDNACTSSCGCGSNRSIIPGNNCGLLLILILLLACGGNGFGSSIFSFGNNGCSKSCGTTTKSSCGCETIPSCGCN